MKILFVFILLITYGGNDLMAEKVKVIKEGGKKHWLSGKTTYYKVVSDAGPEYELLIEDNL